jgi:uncharacterized membrane protein (DUF4010 family)
LGRLAPAIGAGLAVIAVEAVIVYRRAQRDTIEAVDAKIGRSRSFSFWPALVIAFLLTAVTLAAKWGADTLGPSGAVLVAAIGGLADAHAPVLAVASLVSVSAGSLTIPTAAVAAGVALATNTISKLAVPSPPSTSPVWRRRSALWLWPWCSR